MGGVIGIAGPPMVWYLGKRFAKRSLRQVLVPVFLGGSVTRLLTYAATGVVDRQVLVYGLASMPGLVLGIYLGNRVFLRVSENTFSRFVGVVLVVVAIRLAF